MSFESQSTLSAQSLTSGGAIVADAACSWQLVHGRVLRLRFRQAGVLRVSSGRAWVTMDRVRGDTLLDAGDLFVSPGQDLPLRGGQSLVLESWSGERQGCIGLEWVPLPQPAPLATVVWARVGRYASVLVRRLWFVQRQPRF